MEVKAYGKVDNPNSRSKSQREAKQIQHKIIWLNWDVILHSFISINVNGLNLSIIFFKWLTKEVTSPHCTGILYSIVLCFLCSADLAFFANRRLWQPHVKQGYQHYLPSSICSLHAPVSHFGNSCTTSNFFIIFKSVLLICDQWSLRWPLYLFWGTTHRAHKRQRT